MRSIAHAMLWEFYRTIRWVLVPLLVTAAGIWIYPCWLLNQSAFDSNSPEFILIHEILSLGYILVIAICFALFQAPISRSYGLPISTATLVAWRLFLPCIAVGLIVALGFSAGNLLLDTNLPILGLSLFAFALTAPTYLAFSQCRTTISWSFAFGIGMLIALCYWARFRYQDSFSSLPTHLWKHFTLGEFTTLLIATTLTYFAAVRSVAEDRCGEEWLLSYIETFIERFRGSIRSRSQKSLRPFTSPRPAQFWYEYRQKGAAFPAIIALFLSFYFVPLSIYGAYQWSRGRPLFPDLALPHLVANVLAERIYQAIYYFGMIGFSAAGLFAGCFIGISRSGGAKRQRGALLSESIHESEHIRMGAFQATLPMVPIQFAAAIYRTIIQSVLVTWLVWGVFLACSFAAHWKINSLNGASKIFLHNTYNELWFLPLTLLLPWIAMANFASIWLTGRIQWVICIVLGGLATFFGTLIAVDALVSPTLQESILFACDYLLSFVILAGTVLAFKTAASRKLIGNRSLLWGAVISVSITVGAIVTAPFPLSSFPLSSTVYLTIFNLAAIVVLPLASIPLAIAFNRHR